MRRLLFLFAALMLISAQANAFFIIDFNEKWLREDAYNRAMSQAKKDMQRGGSSAAKSSAKGGKTDPLWTGPQMLIQGSFFDDEGIDDVVERFPYEQRKDMRKALTQIIASFNDSVEKLYGVPKENVATGMVALLAGGYAAYYNKPFPDKYVKSTVEQVGTYLRSKPELFEGKTTEKRRNYQKSVGVGMLLQLLQQEVQKSAKASDAAQLKQAGAQVIRAVLNVEPDQVEFTSSGLKFR